jgi:hypothetical protein
VAIDETETVRVLAGLTAPVGPVGLVLAGGVEEFPELRPNGRCACRERATTTATASAAASQVTTAPKRLRSGARADARRVGGRLARGC